MFKKKFYSRCAQNLMEYSLVLGLLALILFAMGPMIKRGSQGMIKFVADQVGNQQTSDQIVDDESGRLEKSVIMANSLAQKRTQETMGDRVYSYDERSNMLSTTGLNLGFSKDSE